MLSDQELCYFPLWFNMLLSFSKMTFLKKAMNRTEITVVEVLSHRPCHLEGVMFPKCREFKFWFKRRKYLMGN